MTLKRERQIAVAAILVLVFAAVAVTVYDTVENNSSGAGFDHYKTDVGIVVNPDGSITETDDFWFSWQGIGSSEMYISKPADMAGSISVISVSVDGQELTKASSYQEARTWSFVYSDVTPYQIPKYYAGINPDTGNYEINAFYPYATSGSHLITFKYSVIGAVTKYSDCVDFYYKVFTNFSEDLKDLTVSVTMPDGALQENTRIFGHGDPNGVSAFSGDTANALFTSSNLQAYTMFEIRVVSQQVSLFDLTPKEGKTFASILAEEKRDYDKTQSAIQLNNILKEILPVTLALMVLMVPLHIYLVKRPPNRKKPNFNQRYLRDVPSIKPNLAASLNDYYKADNGSLNKKIAATILNLALQKKIAIEKDEDNDMVFIPLSKGEQMTPFEKNVFEMIFSRNKNDEMIISPYKNGELTPITLKRVKNKLKTDSIFSSTVGLQMAESDKKELGSSNYAEKRPGKNNSNYIIAAALLVLLAANFLFAIIIGNNDLATIIMVVAFFELIVILMYKPKTPLTQAGADERAKILALKRFYTDMTLMKERQALELSVWEEHLVYATALGVSDKVIKELEVRLAQMNVSGQYIPHMVYLGTFSQIGSLSNSINSLRTVPLSAYRAGGPVGPGGGGGGGFYGGGGGGFGGGGGGHR